MSSTRTFKKMAWAHPTGNGARRSAARSEKVYAARRAGMYTVPRTMGALAQTERKYFDSFLNGATIAQSVDWTGTELDPATLNCMFAPTEGSDINNRIGRRVHVLKQSIRGVIKMAPANGKTAAIDQGPVRLVWFIDNQTNATQAQGEQLMASPGAATKELTTSTFQNTANFGRFTVLKDKLFHARPDNVFNDGTDGAANAIYIPFKFKRSFGKGGLEVRFNGTNGGTVSDVVDKSFHLVGNGMASDQTLSCSYQVRTVYSDN